MDLMANTLLAIQASPAMVHAEEEAEVFSQLASVLLVNVGTLSPPWVGSMKAAARACQAHNKAWVLDPVGCGATTFRTQQCRELLLLKPTLVRGNASEILALAGKSTEKTRGVDSTVETSGMQDAWNAAASLASEHGCIVVVTGATDFVTDGSSTAFEISNGVPMLQAITATGCAVTAVCAAFLSVCCDGDEETSTSVEKSFAVASALACFGLAAELATVRGGDKGPGSLRVGLLDALYNLKESEVVGGEEGAAGVRITLVNDLP
jgi:hydroxyethylthiazole kinase